MGEHGYDPARKPGKTRIRPARPARHAPKEIDTAGMTGLLLQLQSLAGNQTVDRLVQRQTAQHDHALPRAGLADAIRQQSGAGSAPVQRRPEPPVSAKPGAGSHILGESVGGAEEMTVGLWLQRQAAQRQRAAKQATLEHGAERRVEQQSGAGHAGPGSRASAVQRESVVRAETGSQSADHLADGSVEAMTAGDQGLTLDDELEEAPPASDEGLDAPNNRQVSEDGGQPTIQRLMSYDEFKKLTGQTASVKRRGLRGPSAAKRAVAEAATESWTDILSGKTGEEALKADREKKGRSGSARADINFSFEEYQNNPSLATMIGLYDKITYWETLNAGYKWADDLKPVLDKVKRQIEADVQAETEKQAGDAAKTSGGMLGKAKTAAGSLLGKGGRAARAGASATAAAMKPLLKEYPEWETGKPGQGAAADAKAATAATMPPFLQEVGVSQGYYDDYLKGHPEHIQALEAFYNGLNEGRLHDATSAYRKVSHLEGMYLIKPLFLSHFANQVNLGGLVGTDAKAMEGAAVTKEEEKAILTYSSEAYIKMNKQLRDHTVRSAGRPGMGTQRAEARAATMQAAVSGLNKFPKFQGIAYRVSINVPPGYFAAVRPGGMLVDLAFNSASPSMTGVGLFADGYGVGSKSLYYIIHTKTAVNIVGLAHGPTEGEILFRPGTRFLVKAVWEHVNGKVPPGAPPQAQMVLHSQGEEKWAGGKAGHYGDYYFKLASQKPDASAEEIKKEAYATMQKEGKITKVKVIELEEV